MNTSEEEHIELEARSIPSTKSHWHHWGSPEGIIMDIPSDLELALREMKHGKVITSEELKKDFLGWRQCIIRMSGFNMVFTKHFESQLNTVLAYYEEQHGYMEFSSALFFCR